MPINYIRQSAAGILVGIVALTMVSAVLGGSLAAIHANDTVRSLAADLHAARIQNEQLHATVDQLADQNRRILAQNDALVRFLRRHGLQVPRVVYTPPPPSTETPSESGSQSSSPKPSAPTAGQQSNQAPSSPSPAPLPRATVTVTPSPTPSTEVDPLELVCRLTPILCTTG